MATRKPRRAASRRTSPRRAPRARTGRKTAAGRRSAATPERRRQDPQTLRLRTIEPGFTVNDLQRSLRFYTDVLGFVVGERFIDGGVLRGVILKAGACGLGLSQDDWAKGRDRKKGEGMRIWCQTVQDIDALAARIKGAGGQLTEGPKDEPWGGRSLSVVDPDGFRISIYREQ
jgi:catechol 2,3-dioxygenase-like lactoylglutathione lyase family enzyme